MEGATRDAEAAARQPTHTGQSDPNAERLADGQRAMFPGTFLVEHERRPLPPFARIFTRNFRLVYIAFSTRAGAISIIGAEV